MQPVMIYIVSDGKPGHLAQSRGLAEAIARQRPARIMEISSDGMRVAPQPPHDGGVILAAGRSTHSFALSLRKYLGVPAISLMNPGWLNRQRFDLSIIPRHDGIRESRHVLVTDGAINGMTFAEESLPGEGLLLVGGPSRHHRWDAAQIRQQVETLLQRAAGLRWTATDSRRTPDRTTSDFIALAQGSQGRLTFTPASQTPAGWVSEQLQRCRVCWVSEDSVSMVYEALTAGANVGLIKAPRISVKPGRVVKGIESLVERNWVLTFDQWQQGAAFPDHRPKLAEADRVASYIIGQCLTPDLNR